MRLFDWYAHMSKKYSDAYIAELRARMIKQLDVERVAASLARSLMSILLHSAPVLYDANRRSVWMLRLPSWTFDNFDAATPGWYRAVLVHIEGDGWHIFWTRSEQ